MIQDINNKSIWDNYNTIKNRKSFSKIYKTIDVKGFDFRKNFEVITSEFIDNNSIILDTGCGVADHLIKYSNNAKQVYGIDFNEHLINKAIQNTKKLPNFFIKIMDVQDLKFNNNYFDLVTSVYNPQNSKSTHEISRVLKSSGRYIRTSGAGDFVLYNNKFLVRPQDVVGRGSFIDFSFGEVSSLEENLIIESNFSIDRKDMFQGIKFFKTIDDLINHVKDSGHFKFYPPYKGLQEDEINILKSSQDKFAVDFQDSTLFGVPFDLFLLIGRKS